MAQPYIGEIRLFAGNFAPAGWAFCNGQLMAISDNEPLFQLIGTTYGGDGQNTFALPDLQGRVPIHQGTSNFGVNFVIGQLAGEETVTLTTQQLPAHSHALRASANASTAGAGPAGNLTANTSATTSTPIYSSAAPGTAMAASAIGTAGGSQPHDNMAPFQCVSFIISLFGIFPTTN
jgi:microcystin-dependent protein